VEHDLVSSLVTRSPRTLAILPSYRRALEARSPVAEARRIAYSTNDDRLVAASSAPSSLTVYTCRGEAAVGHANTDRVYGSVSRLCDIGGARAFRESERVYIFIEAVSARSEGERSPGPLV